MWHHSIKVTKKSCHDEKRCEYIKHVTLDAFVCGREETSLYLLDEEIYLCDKHAKKLGLKND